MKKRQVNFLLKVIVSALVISMFVAFIVFVNINYDLMENEWEKENEEMITSVEADFLDIDLKIYISDNVYPNIYRSLSSAAPKSTLIKIYVNCEDSATQPDRLSLIMKIKDDCQKFIKNSNQKKFLFCQNIILDISFYNMEERKKLGVIFTNFFLFDNTSKKIESQDFDNVDVYSGLLNVDELRYFSNCKSLKLIGLTGKTDELSFEKFNKIKGLHIANLSYETDSDLIEKIKKQLPLKCVFYIYYHDEITII